jgi:cell division protein FtsI/penicillin-binding protein 2
MTVKEAIAYSRNVATAKLARKLAPNSTQKATRRLHALWAKVGIVGRTGVDITGEEYGNAWDPAEKLWAPVDLANRAFGQGVSVTLPQLARGLSTLVNGGYLVQPHIAVDGEQAKVEPTRVLAAKTARQAKEILRYVTGGVPWYAKGSLIPGYDIGGKTGTAQIWDVKRGDWKKNRFNHNFVGFVAGHKQEYVIAVRIEEPVPIYVKQGDIPLNIASYELFQNVARSTIKELDMKKSKRPGAGLTIVGSEAARVLDPVRNRQAVRASKKESRRAERQLVEAARSSTAADEGTEP